MSAPEIDDKIYAIYYSDVGKHAPLSAQQEWALFEQYRVCSLCNEDIPLEVLRTNCPHCGMVIDTIDIKTRLKNCNHCNKRFELYTPPKFCYKCGNSRNNVARNKIIEANLRFVVGKAIKLSKDDSQLKTLISAGNIGIVIAIDKFDHRRGTRFLTYAAWWIQKEMFDTINNTSSLVRIPAFKRKEMSKALKIGKLICQHCELRTDEKEDPELPPCTEKEHSFIDTTQNENNILIGGGIELESEHLCDHLTPELEMIIYTMKDTVRSILRKSPLSPREKYILIGYYNITQSDRMSEPKNLGQLSSIVGVTPERVRQLKTMALNKMKHRLRNLNIKEALDLGS